MTATAELLADVQQRFADFLRTQSEERLHEWAEGELELALVVPRGAARPDRRVPATSTVPTPGGAVDMAAHTAQSAADTGGAADRPAHLDAADAGDRTVQVVDDAAWRAAGVGAVQPGTGRADEAAPRGTGSDSASPGAAGSPEHPTAATTRGADPTPRPAGAAGVGSPTTSAPSTRAAGSTKPTKRATRRKTKAAAPPVATMAATLRGMETVEQGREYLDGLGLTVPALVEIGKELGLRMPSRPRKPDALRKVLNQAIGARRKFAGLREW